MGGLFRRSKMASAQRASAALAATITGLALIIGCSGDDDAPTTPQQSGSIAISPRSLSLTVGGSGSLTTTIKNSAGAVVPGATAVWVSRKPATATVDNAGRVAALAVGTTTVVATYSQVSDSVSVTVIATPTGSASCNGVTAANTFQGTLDYDWGGVGPAQGGFVIHSEQKGSLKATLTRISATAAQATWAGDVTGTASLDESKSNPAASGTTSTMKGGGSMVALASGAKPTLTLIIDLQACTYQLEANATLNALRTDPSGSTSRSDVQVAILHTKAGRALGTLSTGASGDGTFDGHSQTWSGLNPNQDAFIPLSLAAELMGRSATEPAVGQAKVSWVLLPK
jgi:hypothetical protein